MTPAKITKAAGGSKARERDPRKHLKDMTDEESKALLKELEDEVAEVDEDLLGPISLQEPQHQEARLQVQSKGVQEQETQSQEAQSQQTPANEAMNESHASEKKTCYKCEQDDTVSQEDKQKQWDDKNKLEQHLKSYFHCPKMLWIRKERQRQAGRSKLRCPYCERLGMFGLYSGWYQLSRHIERGQIGLRKPELLPLASIHKQYAEADGWFRSDWIAPFTEEDYRAFDRFNTFLQETYMIVLPEPAGRPQDSERDASEPEHPNL